MSVKPLHYKIRIEPDLQRFRFDGKVEIQIDASDSVREISMNALDLAIWNCRVKTEKEEARCAFSVNPEKETLSVFLPQETAGRLALTIEYEGVINNSMAGFYRSGYTRDGVRKNAAVTQFEENDARRAFPCFDHPAMKASFEIEMVVERGLTAISNNPVSEETEMENGKRLVRFQITPRMSTYLLFFAVGEFEFLEDTGDVLIRLAAAPGMARFGDLALEFSRKALLFSEQYYGIKYPLPKLDVVAISDFAAGAMENWGAITFRENLLLRDPQKTSRAGEERICEVIAHEMAHQWFGDLVTPQEWEYLWLNESFATYFGFGIVDHYHPEWEVWGRFLHDQTDIALERDGLYKTIPIEIPGGGHVVINVSTAPIIYNKGGSILRQIEGFVGSENFKKGLRHYLRKHAYGNATSHDLWEAFEEVSARPVSSMIRNWIEQPGYPIIHAKRQGTALHLTQERFTYLRGETTGEWIIPVSVKLFHRGGGTETVHTIMEKKDAVVPLGEDTTAYFINEGATGFYRVRYGDQENLMELGREVADKRLSPEERWSLQNDLYGLVKRGDTDLEAYLSFLAHFSEEDHFLPLMSIGDHLFHAFVVFEGDGRAKAATAGRVLFEKVLSRIGYDPAPDEEHAVSILREQLLWHSALYGSKEALSFGHSRFDMLREGKGIHPDIMRSAMQIGAFCGGGEVFDWFEKAFSASENEHERINMLLAIGCFQESSMIDRTERFLLEKVPDRNKFMVIGAMAANPYARFGLWEWYLSSLERLEKLHPVHYERVIAALIPWSGLGRKEQVRSFFHDYLKSHEKLRDVIELSLERLEIHSRMRERVSDQRASDQ